MFTFFLSACGGGDSAQVAMDTTAFVAKAKLEKCGDIRNKLYVLDERTVLWERAGNCADNASAQVLFGDNVDTVLCTANDTVGGQVAGCKDPANRAVFDTIRNNLNRADLGLAGSYRVREVSILAP
jgi:hypothetical protein